MQMIFAQSGSRYNEITKKLVKLSMNVEYVGNLLSKIPTFPKELNRVKRRI